MFRKTISVAVLALLCQPALADVKHPNIVFFLVDDLGYMDVEPNNPNTFYETPNVSRLAKRSLRFTDGYAANPVCSPTRFSIMTGRYPSRVDATNFFAGKRPGKFRPAPLNDRMPLEEWTLGEALQSVGYRTAFLGKWHLGPAEPFWPENQGFDINVGGHHRGSPPGGYFSPFKNPRLKDGVKGEHLTTRLTDEALRIIEQSRDNPFLLYLSFYTVHTPLQAPPELVEKYRRKAAKLDPALAEFSDEEQVWPRAAKRRVRILQKHAVYAAMVETMDRSIGRVLDKLDELNLADNTVICFMSDNGGLSTSEGSPTSNLPLRGGKGWLYEGGIREPYMIAWPGVTTGGAVTELPVCSVDFLPTLCEIAGVQQKPPKPLDGESLVPILRDASKSVTREALYWHYPHYSNQGGFPGGAVRRGRYKLIERFENGDVHLYDLATDRGERNDLAETQPDRANEMREMLHRWYEEVDAKFLQAKPDSDEQPWRP